MPKYKVVGQRPVNGVDPGEPLEQELDDRDERSLLARGLIEIEPARFKVVGPNAVYGTDPGDIFERALTAGEERSLVEGGHIEPARAAPRKKSSSEEKE